MEGDALVSRDEEHGATTQSHFGGCSCGGAHGCPLDHQQDAGRVHGRDEVQLDGGGDLQWKGSPRLESAADFLLFGELEGGDPCSLLQPLLCPGHPAPAAAQAQGPQLS